MTKPTIVTMPGDGIGKTVLPESLRVLEKVGFAADYVDADIGWEFWCSEGNALPQRTIDLLAEHRVGLFGAITSKPKEEAAAELDPSLADEGFVYYSPIVGLRQHFDLQLCVRPCRTFQGNPLNFIRRTADGFDEPPVDVVIFRQNTEGLYAGVEWTDPPDDIRAALETHVKMAAFKDTPSADLAISTRIFTRAACRYITSKAFDYAAKHGYRSVTICEKPNVIRETSGMMNACAREAKERHPDIDLWFTNIDAQMMWLTKNPEDYGVIVAGNMFGDIISDGFAGLVGGLGFACSANVGEDCAVFEPTHGSAPKYADYERSIVNPIAMILSACMMLDHLGETDKADAIRTAIAAVVDEGKIQTYDMKKLPGRQEVLDQGAATTEQLTDAILEKLWMVGAGDIEKLFMAQLEKIEDTSLVAKVVEVWVAACEKAGVESVDELTSMPFTLLTDSRGINFVEHTIAVTEGALALGQTQVDAYRDMPYVIDFDRLVAGGLLHDVGKILEIEPDGEGGWRKSRSGMCARHPISGAILAAQCGCDDELVNTIACHAKEGDGRPQVVETVLIHQADFATFNPLVMKAAGKLIE